MCLNNCSSFVRVLVLWRIERTVFDILNCDFVAEVCSFGDVLCVTCDVLCVSCDVCRVTCDV